MSFHHEEIMRSFLRNTHGATAVEYGLIAGVLVLVMLVGLIALGEATTAQMTDIAARVDEAM
jgi:Flp pilus assembly pilin Flp